MKGRLIWVLHAHLPFVRHPEHPRFFEEDWLFEAMEAVYLPLLEVLEGWADDGVDARLTISFGPPLVAMLQDELLQARFRAHLDRKSALLHEESRRLRRDSARGPLARSAARRLAKTRRLYEARAGDLVGAFARLSEAGIVDLATTSLSHALLPLFAGFPRFVERQIQGGVARHRRAFGRAPVFMWLPECAWFPAADDALAEAGLRATVLEGIALGGARPPAACGVDRPAATRRGTLILGRDPEVARAVWSAEVGFPGDPRYLDFHHDATFELDDEAVQPFLLPTGARVPLRLRYAAVTDRKLPGERKLPYSPDRAREAAREHAESFIDRLSGALFERGAYMGWPAVSVAPFDAELFGHWWHEGPLFLDLLARETRGRLEWSTPTRELALGEPLELLEPAPSTWGARGDFSVWLAEETGALWSGLLSAVADLEGRARPADPRLARVFDQLGREVAHAAASDWTFLIRMKTAVEYAQARLQRHLENAASLRGMLDGGVIDEARVAALERRHP